MNPWGLLLIILGILMIIVGVKGSQHNIVATFKGAGSTAKNQ
jgi:hypothetical protein